MKRQELVELLSVHADSLKEGVDLTEALLAERTPEDRAAGERLLLLARRVKAALVPVEPRLNFAAELRARLRAQARVQTPVIPQSQENQRRLLWVAGGVICLIGLSMMGVRVAVGVLSLIAAILGWRTVRPALPKTRMA